jgi:hypothetical protein
LYHVRHHQMHLEQTLWLQLLLYLVLYHLM